MWDNPRILNMAAGALVGIAALIFATAGIVLVLRSPLFPVTQVEVTHPLARTTKEDIQAAMRGRLGGNFFAVAPADVRAALEELPWVRRVSVRRVWPDRLRVTIEEHVALARWGGVSENPDEQGLVNTFGERFNGWSEDTLPMFVGPAGAEQELTRRYARFAALVQPLGTGLERVVLTQRYAWQLRLANGLHVMLGRDGDAAELRLEQFVRVYPETLGKMARKHEYVDLRYSNGFALRVPELRS